ncbi:hypothetical protein KO507_17990 [Gilvimarinus agarilyticus]|uniref:hypothetical protein n=1 Tax=Gilvimarinus sp. 2_MG-2023 TaxID=3062666 RepID=UPI001C09F0DD|nr:hypothetical protein [Gilvimarinus sp. 2_MG-2023]MBU2887662.1 hypothetical protein [Gilvimarinus agarilyticus]MDO6572311.1 hypothetical protein [Gilvimarinus sp. 2_MG-2023]
MQGKSRLAAVVIILTFVVIAGLYTWAGGERARLTAYGFLSLDREQMVVNFDHHWIWFDVTGREQRSVDLSAEGLRPVGDFDFFANGDLLVLHRAAPRSTGQNIRAFLRLQSAPEPAHQSEGERSDGFYRCRLTPLHCTHLATIDSLPARSSRLLIDRQNDHIYLADTSDHALYKYSDTGRLLAQKRTGFKFPNQLVWHDNGLWLADTNHHRVVQLDTREEYFAEVLQAHSIELGGNYRWPHQLASSASGLWVLVGNNAMARGKLRLLDQQGELNAPLNAGLLNQAGLNDPQALHYWQDYLWLTDFTEPKLVLVNSSAGLTEEVQSPTLRQLEQAYHAASMGYKYWQYLAGALFIVLLVLGFVAAWRLEKPQTQAKFKAFKGGGKLPTDGEITPTGQDGVLWVSSGLKPWHHWAVYILWGATFICSVLLIWLYVTSDKLGSDFFTIMLAMIAFLVLVSVAASKLFHSIMRAKLGVVGESLVLDDGAGRSTVAKGEALAYTAHYIFADNVVIALGNQNLSFFAQHELERWVFPRLRNAQKLSVVEQAKRLWQLRHPQLIYTGLILGFMLILLLLLEWFG